MQRDYAVVDYFGWFFFINFPYLEIFHNGHVAFNVWSPPNLKNTGKDVWG